MIVTGLLVTSAVAEAQRIKAGPVTTGPGTLTAARKYLEGRWSLITYDIYPPGKPSVRLDGQGTLLYDDFGNLEMDIRVNEKTAILLEDVGIQITNGRLATKGRTAIDLQAKTLVFVLDGQPAFGKPSGPLALNRPRHWEVTENELTLTTKGDDGKPLSIGRWRKVPK